MLENYNMSFGSFTGSDLSYLIDNVYFPQAYLYESTVDQEYQ